MTSGEWLPVHWLLFCVYCSSNMCALGTPPRNRYQLVFEDRTDLGVVVSGAELMDHGINVTRMDGAEASEVVWLDELAKDSLTTDSSKAESK